MRNSFVLYTEYKKHFPLLTMEQRGVLFTAIMEYQSGGVLPEMDSGVAMAFSFIKEQLDRDEAKYAETAKKRSEAGAQGGRPRKQMEADDSFRIDEKAKEAKKANAFPENQTEAGESEQKQNNPDNEYVDVDEYVDEDSLSYGKKERKNISLASSTGARKGKGKEPLESYDDLMTKWEVGPMTRAALWKFIQHCDFNGRKVTNDKLEDIIDRLQSWYCYAEYGDNADKEQSDAVYRAIRGGYFDIKEGRR